MTDETLKIEQIPDLHEPSMVVGITGWVDGGGAATYSVSYLIHKLGAEPFTTMPASKFRLYQLPSDTSLRPIIKIENGVLKAHRFLGSRFYQAQLGDGTGDLIILRGTEPNMNWETYAGNILEVAELCRVKRIYVLGGVLDQTPHTREPAVSCVTLDPAIVEELIQYEIQPANYLGPGSFPTTLLEMSRERDIPVVLMHTRVTYYPDFSLVIPNNPQAAKALLSRLNTMLSLEMDLSDLDEEIAALHAKLNELAAQNPKFKEYVHELEMNTEDTPDQSPLDISAEDAVRFAEEFLKDQRE